MSETIISMTGFGRGTAEAGDVHVVVEIKSVNNRYLDIHCRLPREFFAWEEPLRARIKKDVLRGRVDVSPHLYGAARFRKARSG